MDSLFCMIAYSEIGGPHSHVLWKSEFLLLLVRSWNSETVEVSVGNCDGDRVDPGCSSKATVSWYLAGFCVSVGDLISFPSGCS